MEDRRAIESQRMGQSSSRVFLLLCVVCTVGCARTAPQQPQQQAVPIRELPAGPTVRVMTYNVNWGAVRPNLAVAAIREADADVVCLQETTPEWETYLRG